MLERSSLEITHLKQRRQLDTKLLRAQQSKAFFMEELAQAEQQKGGAQQANQQVRCSQCEVRSTSAALCLGQYLEIVCLALTSLLKSPLLTCSHTQQVTGKEREAAMHALELSGAKLEIELCHRALALLRLQLSSVQEDVDHLQVLPLALANSAFGS